MSAVAQWEPKPNGANVLKKIVAYIRRNLLRR